MDTWVAVAGTLLGALLAGGLQAWSADRARKSAREDAQAQRVAAQEALTTQLAADRSRRMWDERRAAFVELLSAGDSWHRVNLDLKTSDLPNTEAGRAQVGTHREAAEALPEAGELLEAMATFGLATAKVQLLTGRETWSAVGGWRQVLQVEARAAVKGEQAPAGPTFGEAQAAVMLAMRRDLDVIEPLDPAQQRERADWPR